MELAVARHAIGSARGPRCVVGNKIRRIQSEKERVHMAITCLQDHVTELESQLDEARLSVFESTLWSPKEET